RDPSERLHLHRLALGEEPIDDTALVQHLDGAGVQTSGARAFEAEAGASLDDEDVGPRQRQLRRQHHPRRTAAGDHRCMLGHTPLLTSPTFLRRLCTIAGGLRQAPAAVLLLSWREWAFL